MVPSSTRSAPKETGPVLEVMRLLKSIPVCPAHSHTSDIARGEALVVSQ